MAGRLLDARPSSSPENHRSTTFLYGERKTDDEIINEIVSKEQLKRKSTVTPYWKNVQKYQHYPLVSQLLNESNFELNIKNQKGFSVDGVKRIRVHSASDIKRKDKRKIPLEKKESIRESLRSKTSILKNDQSIYDSDVNHFVLQSQRQTTGSSRQSRRESPSPSKIRSTKSVSIGKFTHIKNDDTPIYSQSPSKKTSTTDVSKTKLNLNVSPSPRIQTKQNTDELTLKKVYTDAQLNQFMNRITDSSAASTTRLRAATRSSNLLMKLSRSTPSSRSVSPRRTSSGSGFSRDYDAISLYLKSPSKLLSEMPLDLSSQLTHRKSQDIIDSHVFANTATKERLAFFSCRTELFAPKNPEKRLNLMKQQSADFVFHCRSRKPKPKYGAYTGYSKTH